MEEGSMKLIIKTGSLIIFILLTACGSGLDELKRLCEKDAGLTIYKTVEAEGYYDATSIGVGANLIDSDYQFFEFCNDDPKFTRAITEPGCWRVSKVKRELEICYERLDKMLAKNVVEPYPEFLKNHCLAVEKLEKPEAEYKYEVESEEWWINESTGTKMTSGTGRIINNKTGEVLGEGKNYVLFPKWYGSGRSLPSIHCGSYQITGMEKSMPFAVGLIEKTLVPRTDKRKGDLK
jgi:hypothetical protein